ncbi:MAG TPA: TIR domain-containing protein [Sphingomicrobium sp.]|nr:TIR domain-containing protein [Sphingomicrobium sp.]
MADVFVSYARPDEPLAKRMAEALQQRGYAVWRDDELPAHRAYADVIEERLKSAKAVVVLWSAAAAKSQWVRAEADAARGAGTLIQSSIDGTVPPLPFNQIQCADLKDWDGNAETPGWRKLTASLAALAGETKDSGKAGPRARSREVSVCVLPFHNMSGDAEQEYFSDGISEDITTDLSKVSALAVVARNTAFTFKGQSVDVSEVARKLAVSHVLEGSVRKAGTRVRVTAQLIDGRTGDHLWAERYDRDLTDIFAIQDEISKAIVDALKIKLLPEEKKAIEQRGTTNAEAYDLYLMARQYWVTGNWGDVRQVEMVERLCRRALDVDPGYARVWGLLAIIRCILHFTFNASDDNGLDAANKALELDPTIAEAHCVRARHYYEKGEFAHADDELAKALEFGPESWEVNRETARIYYFERRFSESARHFERAVALDDTDFHSWIMLSSALEALGNSEGAQHAAQMALTRAEQVVVQDPTNGSAQGVGGSALGILGERDRAKAWFERAILLNPDNSFMRYHFACSTALNWDDAEAAAALLEPLLEGFSASALKATIADPDFDSVRDSPAFKPVMAKAAALLARAIIPPAAT